MRSPLPTHLEAAEPPEARGLRRDDVRLLVSHVDSRHDRPLALQRAAALARRPAISWSSTPAEH